MVFVMQFLAEAEKLEKQLAHALKRIDLLEENPPDTPIPHDPVAARDGFLDAHPAWNQEDAHVYWKQGTWKDLRPQDYMISSIQVLFQVSYSFHSCLRQVTGTCWLHAVAVLQHLLVVNATGNADHKKVIAQYEMALIFDCCSGRHPAVHCHSQRASCNFHPWKWWQFNQRSQGDH
jgi:hypothetical protein